MTNPENESNDCSQNLAVYGCFKCLKYLVNRVSKFNASIDVFPAVIDYASRR